MPAALPHLFNPSLKRAVVFSSTSVITKLDSEIDAEREMLTRLADAEQKIAAACEKNNVGWTILRPTLIYAEGRDTNITPLSRLIRRFGFMPLIGGAAGLRQPVCGGSCDRRHCRRLEFGRSEQVLFVARRRDTVLPGNDRPNI